MNRQRFPRRLFGSLIVCALSSTAAVRTADAKCFPPRVPPAPTNVRAEFLSDSSGNPVHDSLLVKWNPIVTVDFGGSCTDPVVWYFVQSFDGTMGQNGPSLLISASEAHQRWPDAGAILSGLTQGHGYAFAVIAWNVNGWGAWSNWSTSWQP